MKLTRVATPERSTNISVKCALATTMVRQQAARSGSNAASAMRSGPQILAICATVTTATIAFVRRYRAKDDVFDD